jgi:hypothetical protein
MALSSGIWSWIRALTLNLHLPQQLVAPVSSQIPLSDVTPLSNVDFIVAEFTLLQIQTIMKEVPSL